MKKLAIVLAVYLWLSLSSAFVHAVSLDITSGGFEVMSSDTFRLHNGLVGPKFCWGDFKWYPGKNSFKFIGPYGLEDATFKSQEYFPLEVGNTWTYRKFSGGEMIGTVTATEEICGQICSRLEWSDGQIWWWINDDTGVYLAKLQAWDGSHVTYCPPLKLSNPFMYLGFSKLTSYEEIPLMDSEGTQIGILTGHFDYSGSMVETAITPAGTFADCFRATLANSYTDLWTGINYVSSYEDWWAEGVGFVKQISTQTATLGGTLLFSNTEVLILESAIVGGVTYP